MSSYEQKIEKPDKNYQYLLIACEPYEIVAFKVPSKPIDKAEGKFYFHYDEKKKKFSLKFYFL